MTELMGPQSPTPLGNQAIWHLNRRIGRTLLAPEIAFTMAGLLFVYTRSSIYAAKRNVDRHRAADGGQINWHNESKRCHGALKLPEAHDCIKQIVLGTTDKTEESVRKEEKKI